MFSKEAEEGISRSIQSPHLEGLCCPGAVDFCSDCRDLEFHERKIERGAQNENNRSLKRFQWPEFSAHQARLQ